MSKFHKCCGLRVISLNFLASSSIKLSEYSGIFSQRNSKFSLTEFLNTEVTITATSYYTHNFAS